MIGVPSIRFIPSELQYNVEGSMNEFTVHLNLGKLSTSSKKRKIEEWSEVIKEEETYSKIRHKIRKIV